MVSKYKDRLVEKFYNSPTGHYEI